MRLPKLLPSVSRLSEFQLEEFAKYWFDLSKVVSASLLVKFFEAETVNLSGVTVATFLSGLTIAVLFATLGLTYAKGVKQK